MREFKKVTFENDFHNTSVIVNVCVSSNGEMQLSPNQIKRMHKKLCGSKTCECSGATGTRGRQFYEIEIDQNGWGIVKKSV